MNPYLTPERHPRVKIKISLSVLKEIDFLLDTGFSGGVSLPERLKPRERPIGYQEYELADGSRVVFDLFEVKANYQGIPKTVTAIFSKSEDALVGIEFLEGLILTLNLKKFTISLK